jgi:cupin superfamily acireductone dioxygenase involved in methionine salvage
MKYQKFEVTFRTWNVKSYVVLAEDEDDAIRTAEDKLLDELSEGEEYETMDIIEVNDTDGDYENE